MCVLICRVGERPLLAANRDERYDRPFLAPRLWDAPTPFWAPRDEEEGGTWIGVNQGGLIVGITNRSRLEEQPDRASRGHLVAGMLGAGDLDAAFDWLGEELRRAERNPCQLLGMQGDRAIVCRVGPDELMLSRLEPGIHVLSNLHDADEIEFGLAPDAGWAEMRPILADRSPRLPRGFAVCKDRGDRGTVASALLEPGERFLFAGGPPDRTDYVSVPGYSG